MQSNISRLFSFLSLIPKTRALSIGTETIKRPFTTMIVKSPNVPNRIWCQTASVTSEGNVCLETISDGILLENEGYIRTISSQKFDLTQSVDWMEYLEKEEKRENDEGGAGAYDTMRCDILLSNKGIDISDMSKRQIIIWGQDYHLQRLQNSYLSLVHEKQGSAPCPDLLHGINPETLNEAMQQSKRIVSELLSTAQTSVHLMGSDHDDDNVDTLIQLFRLTLLWSSKTPGPIEPDTTDSILVRGHYKFM